MSRRLPLNLKWLALGSLGLPLAMVLLRLLWPDVSWGFLFLFGLQVMLVLATLQLVVTSIWGPASRWELPIKATRLPRLIFAKNHRSCLLCEAWGNASKLGWPHLLGGCSSAKRRENNGCGWALIRRHEVWMALVSVNHALIDVAVGAHPVGDGRGTRPQQHRRGYHRPRGGLLRKNHAA